jgi:hypothetical protein
MPCVFWDHLFQYPQQIRDLIALRKEADLHARSSVVINIAESDVYIATVDDKCAVLSSLPLLPIWSTADDAVIFIGTIDDTCAVPYTLSSSRECCAVYALAISSAVCGEHTAVPSLTKSRITRMGDAGADAGYRADLHRDLHFAQHVMQAPALGLVARPNSTYRSPCVNTATLRVQGEGQAGATIRYGRAHPEGGGGLGVPPVWR